jgi:hypothetical protein
LSSAILYCCDLDHTLPVLPAPIGQRIIGKIAYIRRL